MTIESNWRFFAERRPYGDGYNLYMARYGYRGKISVVDPLVFTEIEDGDEFPPQPAVDRGHAEAFLRAAMNCAWELGYRPDGFNDTRESMKATTQHLQDMRAIAFHKVGADKP